ASMRFSSELSAVSKEERALVLAFALAELLSGAGERIAWPGLAAPLMARNAAERIATRLEHDPASDVNPDLSSIRAHADVVIFSDFLDLEQTIAWLEPLSARRIRAHLVEIADPAEEVFPYRGHTVFTDPETGARLSLGRAESLAEDYRRLYRARREELSRWAGRLGWTHILHRTDRPASQALINLHQVLGPAGTATSFNGRAMGSGLEGGA